MKRGFDITEDSDRLRWIDRSKIGSRVRTCTRTREPARSRNQVFSITSIDCKIHAADGIDWANTTD
ncbi:MAG: hypothetical protein WBA89_20770 [Microcoleus sp.]|uniref:hypothetical protein n=1 Tax=Microcoleus sp. TaxID=44472 RepID=UPI003C71111B